MKDAERILALAQRLTVATHAAWVNPNFRPTPLSTSRPIPLPHTDP